MYELYGIFWSKLIVLLMISELRFYARKQKIRALVGCFSITFWKYVLVNQQ